MAPPWISSGIKYCKQVYTIQNSMSLITQWLTSPSSWYCTSQVWTVPHMIYSHDCLVRWVNCNWSPMASLMSVTDQNWPQQGVKTGLGVWVLYFASQWQLTIHWVMTDTHRELIHHWQPTCSVSPQLVTSVDTAHIHGYKREWTSNWTSQILQLLDSVDL
jgi:hypothetical protein